MKYMPAGFIMIVTLMMGDICALSLCGSAAWLMKHAFDPYLSASLYVFFLPLIVVTQVLIFAILGLYPALGLSTAEELRRLTIGTCFLFGLVMFLTFVTQSGELWSRQIVLSTWIMLMFFLPFVRFVIRRLCCRWPAWTIPVVVIGAGRTGERVVKMLLSYPWLGLRPTMILDDDPAKQGCVINNVPVVGSISHLQSVINTGIRHGVLAIPSIYHERLTTLIDELANHLRYLYIVPVFPNAAHIVVTTREFGNTLVAELQQNLLHPGSRFLKRSMDIVIAFFVLLFFCWLFFLIGITIALTSPGPIFYRQHRLGYSGKPFIVWKFRTMVTNADELLKRYLMAHPELTEEWQTSQKLKEDPRITAIGRFLRRYSLDELPQFWNVLRGDMSLVGPRPIVESEVAKYGATFALYSKVRPGLTGLWQVSGRNDTTYEERIALDAYYVRNWSIWLDIVILAKTVFVVLRGKGAY